MIELLTADEVLLGFADEVGDTGPVAVEGARTRWSVGGRLAPDTRLVRAPSGVVAHTPEEMTVVVRAGTPVADLHAALAERGQRSALPERDGTVGGAIAVGENAVCVLGRGRLRASVLEVRYVSAEGRLIRGGGPTVKNVTGYDLVRLMVGSLGTLGAIAEVILRTNPIPAVSRWLHAAEADPFAVRDALQSPSAVLWDGTAVWVELEGHAGDVAAEVGRLSAFGEFVDAEGPPSLPPHRWSLRPRELHRLPDGIGSFIAAVGVGTVHAEVPQPPRPLTAATLRLNEQVKAEFDPTGRLNPYRMPGAC